MKSFIIASILLFSTNLFALPVVESVKQSQRIVASCPMCQGGLVVTTTTFLVTQSSCRQYKASEFEITQADVRIEMVSDDTQKVVTIDLKKNVGDCRGMTVARQYSVSTKELAAEERYVLENPTVLSIEE